LEQHDRRTARFYEKNDAHSFLLSHKSYKRFLL
jgi:hypothetical protein